MNDLLEKAQAGDMDAFAALFEPLRAKIFAVACRFVGPTDAEDLTMDAFLKAWKALPGYRKQASLTTWLVRITRNLALDRIRSRAARASRTSSLDDLAPAQAAFLADPGEPTQSETLQTRDDCRVCRDALDRMDPRHSEALLLRYRDDLSYAEIAAALGLSIGTVMSRLFNARRKLKQGMHDLDPDYPVESSRNPEIPE